MSLPDRHSYEFGPFRLDVAEGQLLRLGQEIPLTPKAFQLLHVLVENSGHVLDKDTLMQRVWADSFVEEKNLADNISILRKVLGDDPKEPRYIKTVPRRGYRFVAEVRAIVEESERLLVRERESARVVIEEDDTVPATEAGELEVTARRSLPAHERRRFSPFIVVGALVLAIGLALAAYALWKNRETENAPLARSIAVLPFKPLVVATADPALELGITDALISKLSNIRQVIVRPTNSVLKYSAEGQDLRVAGSELGVDVLLDGRVQKAGDRIRLSVQLVRAADGVPIWAETFDEPFKDVFAVQDAISQRVTNALALQLNSEEKRGLAKRYTDNVEAYQLFLKGEFQWRTFRMDAVRTSINYYNEALKIDPNYALAYAGLAKSYNVISIYEPHYSVASVNRARDAAQKAVDLDPELAAAYVALGANNVFAWQWDAAHLELQRAIQLDPRTDGHTPYGYYLQAMGRPREAVAHLRRTAELSPDWQIADDDVLWGLFFARRYEEVEAECRRAMSLDRSNFAPFYMLGQTQAQTGKHREAVVTLEEGYRVANAYRQREILAELGYVYAAMGDKGKALETINSLRKVDDRFTHMLVARVYTGLGDNDRAFASLDKAYEEHTPFLWEMRVMPQFDGLRSDPRYAALLRRMNLPP